MPHDTITGLVYKFTMFIFLSKLLPLFVYPLGAVSLILLLAIVAARDDRARRRLITFALIILWLASTTGFSNLLARSLEWRYTPPEEVPAADVIVVLGGGTEPAVYPRFMVEVNGAGDRVLYAAQLFNAGKAPRILLSGGQIAWLNNSTTTPAQNMAAILTSIGIPESVLILENASQNTYENAVYSAEILSENEIDRILLVTSALHMPRAIALFEKQGLEVIPLPVDYSVTENASANNGDDFLRKFMDILPQSGNLNLTTRAIKEYLGRFVYRLQGWL